MRSCTLASYVLCLMTTTTFAQAPSTSPNIRIAVVAFNAAVLQTSEAQHELAAMQTKFGPRQAHLESLNTQISSLKKELSDDTKTLSEPEKTAKIKSLDAQERQLQREVEDFKNDTDTASQQMFQNVAQKLFSFLNQYAEQHGYTIILDRGPNEAPAIWYTAKGIDITADLVGAYNSKASSAPSAALPSAPAPHN